MKKGTYEGALVLIRETRKKLREQELELRDQWWEEGDPPNYVDTYWEMWDHGAWCYYIAGIKSVESALSPGKTIWWFEAWSFGEYDIGAGVQFKMGYALDDIPGGGAGLLGDAKPITKEEFWKRYDESLAPFEGIRQQGESQ